MLGIPHPARCPSDQPVEGSEEMVYKRARDDGVSKRDKLRVDSRRTRLAAIPSRTAVDGKLTMQIKGRAAASSSPASTGQQAVREAVVDRAESRSRHSDSPSSRKSRDHVDTHTAAAGSSVYGYRPLSRSSKPGSAGPAEVIAPTDVGPRSSTPSRPLQPVASSLPGFASGEPESLASMQHELARSRMVATPAAVPARVPDPFDDDEDDDAMRRLCSSPVLSPNTSAVRNLQAVICASGSQHRNADILDDPPANVARDPVAQKSLLPANAGPDRRDTASFGETATPVPHSPRMLGLSSRPNQRVNPSSLTPQSRAGLAAMEAHESEENACPAGNSESTLRSQRTRKAKPMLADHISLLETSLNQVTFPAAETGNASVPTRIQAQRPGPAVVGDASRRATAGKTSKLDACIADLEAVLGAHKPTVATATSSTLLHRPEGSIHDSSPSRVQGLSIWQRNGIDGSITPSLTPALHTLEGQFISHRHLTSSASSESYEPASPARTTTSESQDFAPGEFVISPSSLVDATIGNRVFGHMQEKQAASIEKEENMVEDDGVPAYIPPLNARELPPNMPVPAMQSYHSKTPRGPRAGQTTRVHSLPPTLRHPQPRRATSTPTASTLEENASARNSLMIDLVVEYEEEPIDIAARNVKPVKESITKVKFAEVVTTNGREDEESSSSGSSSPTVAASPKVGENVVDQADVAEPLAHFTFAETDILKGLAMPSLARRRSHSSDSSDSDSQPESPVGDEGVPLPLAKKPLTMNGDNHAPVKQSVVPASTSPPRPISEASSRSTSPAGQAEDSGSSNSAGDREVIRAAYRMSAPPIRAGGSLIKKERMKSGYIPQRSTHRYGMHAGYTGPKRNFRTFEYPSHLDPESGWKGSDGVVHGDTAVHPETAYDVAQEQGGHAALATFLENYQTPLKIAGSSNLTTVELLIPELAGSQGYESGLSTSKKDDKVRIREQAANRSELDIFDDLLL